MTGEITLRGKVLPIGGVKEKTLAAHRAGIRTVILPKRNEADLDDIPEEVRRELTFVLVERMEEVLDAVLQPARVEPPITAHDGQAPRPIKHDHANRIENTHDSVETIPDEKDKT